MSILKKQRRCFYLFCSLLVPYASSAALSPQDTTAFNGGYGGLGISAVQFSTNLSGSFSSTFVDGDFIGSNNEMLSSEAGTIFTNAYAGTAYFGYGDFFQNSFFYLAAEVFTNVTNKQGGNLTSFAYQDEDNGSSNIIFMKTVTTGSVNNAAFGLDIRPGILLDTNTLLYGRIGGAFNKMTLNSYNLFSYTDLTQSPNQTFDSTLVSSKTEGITGFRLGLGLERKIAKKLALTADYIWTYYGTMQSSGVGDSISWDVNGPEAITNEDGLVRNSSSKISTQALELGAKYYFG